MIEKKYRVPFSGFAYVRAYDADEALEAAEDDDFVYMETKWGEPEEVDEFIVEV